MEKKKESLKTTIDLHLLVPPYGPNQGGYFYGWPYQGHYSYPPYIPYGLTPPYSSYPPIQEEVFGDQLIPAGSLMVLVDPISSEVFLDGLLLRQHADLSYDVRLLEGAHRIEVKADGYESFKKEFDIPGGKRIILTIRLNPK